jgi:hypothetical protein
VQGRARGFSRLFSLLDRVDTTWSGSPSTPHRHVAAVFSAVVFEAISTPRALRPVDLAVLRALGHQRELAKRLFLLLESLPAARLDGAREVIERVVDARLAATLGSQAEPRELVGCCRAPARRSSSGPRATRTSGSCRAGSAGW